MCEWNKYGSFRIDPCMIGLLEGFKKLGYKPIASCCGHGKYPKSIIVKYLDGSIVELFSDKVLSYYPRKSKRYYKRDKEGYFYIPEVVEAK